MTDPRSTLAAISTASVPPPATFAGAELGLFYRDAPAEESVDGRFWYLRGQNFILSYTEAAPGAVLARRAQIDEYVIILPDPLRGAVCESGGQRVESEGYSLIIMPPGDSVVALPEGGVVVRLFSTRSVDLVAKCSNVESYSQHRSNIPPFQPWPHPKDGFRIRRYSLDVPEESGRFGKIWRCTTMMVNYFPSQMGPRDVRKLSPHHHDTFEQCSLALEGAFVHHLRWPWTVDMLAWRDDLHASVGSPSAIVIPPPAVHTTQAVDHGSNLLVDIFSPPRIDFSEKVGWVLNADEYPMPEVSK